MITISVTIIITATTTITNIIPSAAAPTPHHVLLQWISPWPPKSLLHHHHPGLATSPITIAINFNHPSHPKYLPAAPAPLSLS